MIENQSTCTCGSCIHADVCRYKDYFILIVEAAMTAEVITDLNDPEKPVAPINHCNWVNISIGCMKFNHK